MQKFILFLIITLFIQSNLHAQQTDESMFKGAGGYVSYGLDFVHTSSLNNSLKQYKLPGFGSTQMNISIGGGTFLNKMYFGGQGGGQFGLSAANDYYQSSLGGGYGMLQFGYAPVHTSSVAFYPTLGIGGGGSLIYIKESPADTENPDASWMESGSNIHSGYMLLDLGLNGDFYIGSGNDKTAKIYIGVSAGYQFHPLVTDWNYQDQELSDLAKYAPDGFYVKVKLGLGDFLEKRPGSKK